MKHIKKFKLFEFDQSLIDKPREVVILHPEYKQIVKQVSLIKDYPEKIKTLLEKWIEDNEEWLANRIFCTKTEDMIYCEHGSEIVGKILSDAKIDHWLEVGNIYGVQRHAWARVKDTIIDPTKDQFKGIQKNDYEKAIFWKKEYTF